LRSSDRISKQPNADLTQLERAQQRAQAKDQGSYSGTNLMSKFSVISISNDDFISRASKLGVSLGTSPSKISSTIDNIKGQDHKRTLIMLSKNLKEKENVETNETPDILNEANDLSVDLCGDDLNGQESERNICTVVGKSSWVIKKKEKRTQVEVRRSTRLSKKK
jgi:hypothetical protein